MSYEIVYNRQFLRVDDKVIPLALHGSNNCYEMTYNGRERRERYWSPLYCDSNRLPIFSEDELMEYVQSLCNGSTEHFVHNGRWVDDAGLLKFFRNGIKNAKTIEELQDEYYFSHLSVYLSVWNRGNNTVEGRSCVRSTKELKKFLSYAEDRINNREDTEDIFVGLVYNPEKFKHRETKQKQRLTNFFAIKTRGYGYVYKLTSRRLQHVTSSEYAKQFKTEKEAYKYIEKLSERFNADFEVEYITS